MSLSERIFNYLERRWRLVLIMLFTVNWLLRWWVIYNSRLHILLVDAYAYLLKALEITKGDFSPIATHALGWPLFLAPFLYLLQEPSIFVNMVWVSLISTTLGALAIFPLAYLGRKILNREGLIILLFIFTFADGLNKYLLPGFSEPLFTILFLGSLAFLLRSQEDQKFILPAALLAGLVYWVKPSGLILLPILLAAFWWLNKDKLNFSYRLPIFAVIVFFLISLPFLYQRFLYFGSPFFYGENSRYFAEDYQQVWGKEYTSSPATTDFINRFLINGLGLILVAFFWFYLPPLLWPFLLYGLISSRADPQKKLFDVLLITVVIWVLILMPIFKGFGMPRHLYAIASLLFIIVAQGTTEIFRNFPKRKLALSLFLLTLITFSLAATVYYVKYDMLIFVREKALSENFKIASQFVFNLKGRAATDVDITQLMTYLPDTRVGGAGLLDLYAPVSGLSIVYPGYFEKSEDLIRALKRQKVDYLILTDNVLNQSPWSWINLRIYGGQPATLDQPPFQEIYSNYQTNRQWQVRLFKIDWGLTAKD